MSPGSGGVLGLERRGLGLAGLATAGPETATVNNPVPRRGSLGLTSKLGTLTDKEGVTASADAGEMKDDLEVAAGTEDDDNDEEEDSGDLRLGDFSLGSRAEAGVGAEPRELSYFVGETIFNLESSGLV